MPLGAGAKDLCNHTGQRLEACRHLLYNNTVSQAIRAALYFYLSHKKQVLISHGKTVA